MKTRKATDEDAEQIVRIFHETVHTVNRLDYTTAQVKAWSPAKPDPRQWRDYRLRSRTTVVAYEGDRILGFAELESDGHIDCFYCHHQHIRKGVGAAILEEIETEARSFGLKRLYVEASITAKPFFEAKGFRLLKSQSVSRHEVELTNYLMEKDICPPPSNRPQESTVSKDR